MRAPDIAFVSQTRIEEVGQVEGYWPGAPDLVVEIVSPNDRYTDVEEKTTDWLAAGTRMVLIVNPRKRIVSVYRSLREISILTACDTLSGGDVVHRSPANGAVWALILMRTDGPSPVRPSG